MSKVLIIGESSHGSNCTGLARGFRHLGFEVSLIGSNEYFPKGSGFISKVLRKLFNPHFSLVYNNSILELHSHSAARLVIVYKGSYVKYRTLKNIKQSGCTIFCVFPDISPYNHKSLDLRCFGLYDHLYSAKTFCRSTFQGIVDLNKITHLNHGSDPIVHRPMPRAENEDWYCDVVFIGGWSPSKEEKMSAVIDNLPHLRVHIFGKGWEKSSPLVRRNWKKSPVYGDLYAKNISMSRINLGLLHEIPEPGDNVTARTFEIPGCRGFLLHQYSKELEDVLEPGLECGVFHSNEELITKIQYYLEKEKERENIAHNGFKRVQKDHEYSSRAATIWKSYLASFE